MKQRTSHSTVAALNAHTIHALTGYDTTSKISSKTAIFKRSVDLDLLKGFGKGECTERMMKDAEQFLLQLLGQPDYKTFNEYRLQQFYDGKKDISLEKMVCCSTTLWLHIRRAYFQARLWMTAEDPCMGQIDPKSYGYWQSNGNMRPQMVVKPIRPNNLPEPCPCKKCARETCSCRMMKLGCVRYCGCSKDETCRNPFN